MLDFPPTLLGFLLLFPTLALEGPGRREVQGNAKIELFSRQCSNTNLIIQHVVAGLNNYIRDTNARDDQVGQLADYMRDRIRFSHEHGKWAMKFFICEVLNFVNVIAQIFITDAFLGGEFTQYGTEVTCNNSSKGLIRSNISGNLVASGYWIHQDGARGQS